MSRPDFEERLETLYRADEAGYFAEEYGALSAYRFLSPIQPTNPLTPGHASRRARFDESVRVANRETRAKARATFKFAVEAKVASLLGVSAQEARHLIEAANSRNRPIGWNGIRVVK